MQAAEKGTKLVDEDGLFSLVAAAPETAAAEAKPEVKAEGASVLAAIPAGNFYVGKSSAANGVQAKKAALSASCMAASGALFALDSSSIGLLPLCDEWPCERLILLALVPLQHSSCCW